MPQTWDKQHGWSPLPLAEKAAPEELAGGYAAAPPKQAVVA
jgi:hypothetical protein